MNPTPVQIAVYEPAVRGKSLVVQARTGTGKTAAFGLPLLDQLVKTNVHAVQALILTPTRELALQVARELETLAQFKGTKVVAVYGGAAIGPQVEALQGGAQIVAGTPGRVLDHIRRGTFKTDAIRIFILDEADEMLSMGFAKELHAIADSLPKDRQGLFFSATIPPDIERLAQSQLKDPEFITLSSDQIGALEINHYVYLIPGGDKREAFFRILEVENPESAIVFCNTKDETERLAEYLKTRGFEADWLNGDLEQKDRERVMAATREGKLRFLVCTDVAARGIDISHLTHVINYDFPESAEYYVHRTGRTGRAGRTGTAISVIGPKDLGNLYMMRLTYKIRPIEKQLPSQQELKTREEADLVSMFLEAYGAREPHPEDLALARRLLTHMDAERVLAGLLRDHLGARKEDPRIAAAEARRAKNPPKIEEPRQERPRPERPARVERSAPATAEPARRPEGATDADPRRPTMPTLRSSRTRDRRGGTPHASYTEWEPKAEKDDDEPILAGGSGAPGLAGGNTSGERQRLSPPLPSFTVSEDAPVSSEPETVKRVPRRPAAASPQADAGPPDEGDEGFAQVFLNVGRRDGVKAGDLQRLLTEKAGIDRKDTGRIRVRDRISFVGVKPESLDQAIAAFAGEIIGGRTVIAEKAKARTTSAEV
ncbi:MAG TPA: DEAD/DEAH box helicase [Polyangiaceae bacterium]